MISVLILTLNEEVNIAGCLDSVNWADDVVVFDSYSTDQTVEIAESRGARVQQHEFDDYASQRNAALRNVEYKHSWVLMVDADERVPRELHNEVEEKLSTVPDSVALFRMRRKDFFMGNWLKRSSGYPTWFGRLVRPQRVEVKREVNEEYHAEGEIRNLQAHLLHYPFNKGIGHWVSRHNRYSRMEAEALLEETEERLEWKLLFSRDPVERRNALKQVAYRLPFRPLFVFVYLYFLRLGFLDGQPGFFYAMLRAFYEFLIDLKRREICRRKDGVQV